MTAEHDSPDQNGFGIPVTTITRDGAELKFEIKPIRGSYEGKINPELTTISGTWKQWGASIPLVLKRTSAVPQRGNAVTGEIQKDVIVPMRDGMRLALDLILGPMSAVIHVSSDAPETDIFVRISEEDPSSGHFLLVEDISRVRFQGKKPVRVEVDLWHTAIRIAKGNRLVVDIASASFPTYARNLNTGENSLTGTVHREAKVVGHRSAEVPSFIEFSSVTGVDRQ